MATNSLEIADSLLKENIGEAISRLYALLDQGEPGDAVGLLLRGVERDDIERLVNWRGIFFFGSNDSCQRKRNSFFKKRK